MVGLITFFVVIISIILIILVMLQRSKSGGGLGAVAGGQSEAFFGANAGNVLAKTTAWMIGILFTLILLLTVIKKNSGEVSVISAKDNQAETEKIEEKPAPEVIKEVATPAPVIAPVVTPVPEVTKEVATPAPVVTPVPEVKKEVATPAPVIAPVVTPVPEVK